MIPYDDLASARRDAMRLSEGMTYKWAAAGFPRGGGKGVIAAPPGLDVRARAGLLRRYGQLKLPSEFKAQWPLGTLEQ